MLVLGRQETEEFVIDCGGVRITVKVLKIRRRSKRMGDEVSIGIDAPLDVKVMRSELLDQPDPKPAS